METEEEKKRGRWLPRLVGPARSPEQIRLIDGGLLHLLLILVWLSPFYLLKSKGRGLISTCLFHCLTD